MRRLILKVLLAVGAYASIALLPYLIISGECNIPRIYIVDLAEYGPGRYHGGWIERAGQDAAMLLEKIREERIVKTNRESASTLAVEAGAKFRLCPVSRNPLNPP